MTIHSKWTTGGFAFYNTGTTSTEFIIPTPNHPFAFGEQGIGFDVYFYGATTGSYAIWDEGGDALTLLYSDLNIYGASGSECISFASSDSLVNFSGWNVTYNPPYLTHSTGTGTTSPVTLNTLSNRRQFLGPTTGTGDVLVKLPATSESQGIDFLIWNVWTSGGGMAAAGAQSLLVTTTGMGATTGTIIQTIVPLNYARFYADGLTWRSEKGTS